MKAFIHTTSENSDGEKSRVYSPQPNNGVFSFGRDVNIAWQHGINALAPYQQDGKGLRDWPRTSLMSRVTETWHIRIRYLSTLYWLHLQHSYQSIIVAYASICTLNILHSPCYE